jgi:hypothetical protein
MIFLRPELPRSRHGFAQIGDSNLARGLAVAIKGAEILPVSAQSDRA